MCNTIERIGYSFSSLFEPFNDYFAFQKGFVLNGKPYEFTLVSAENQSVLFIIGEGPYLEDYIVIANTFTLGICLAFNDIKDVALHRNICFDPTRTAIKHGIYVLDIKISVSYRLVFNIFFPFRCFCIMDHYLFTSLI